MSYGGRFSGQYVVAQATKLDREQRDWKRPFKVPALTPAKIVSHRQTRTRRSRI